MKHLLFILIFFLPFSTQAQPKIWFSNKVEFGYGKVFIADQTTFENGTFTKNNILAGLRFKVSKSVSYKTFYLMQNSNKTDWSSEHFLGAVFCLKMQ